MKRTVRNGIAIAGMAGGMLFLGQAVASADEQTATADSGTAISQDASNASGEGAGNLNQSNNESSASNTNETDVETDVEGGDGGDNSASINTGVIDEGGREYTVSSEHEEGQEVSLDLETGDVAVSQEANGGDVDHSGNVHVAGGPDQTATATANTAVEQTASSEGGHENGNASALYMGGGDGAGNLNSSNNQSDASNSNETDIETDVEGGDGGSNWVEINTGLIGVTFNCPEGATCYFNIKTGDVYVDQEANGGDVTNSGNVSVGGDGHDHDKGDHDKKGVKPGDRHDDCPDKEAPAAQPAAEKSAPVAKKALSSAQPKGELAFTGATGEDTALGLTLGLLALGVGGALTLAGRRRETTTV